MSTVDPDTMARLLRRRAASGPLWIGAEGDSMTPAIVTGARILIVAKRRPAWGEVWAVVGDDGAVFAHRFRRRAGGRYVFQGDGRLHSDRPVAASRLVGRVRRVDGPGGITRLGVGDRLRIAWIVLARRLSS
jgi:phage repressor protein C with HTH and peptisase S24 domain